MNSLAKKLILMALCLGAAWSLSAQTTVKGVVTDGSGEPLIGAGVFVEGTSIGTVTGLDGDYELTVPADAVNLVFSFIGLADQVVPINGRSTIDAVLATNATVLDEVVVVGYQTVKRRDLLGSVSSVTSDKLTEQPVTTVSQALTGKMAGVSVVTTEGDPDADIKIRVRGGSSITQDNSPLYIVDGFPVESINDIPSSEIQSIDVLKDAFSTAIYGSRGANGVVIVTTKSAEKGQKVSVKVNSYYGLKKMANADAIQTMDAENFVKFQYELASISKELSSHYVPYFGSFSDIDLYKGIPTNDWIDAVFGNTGSTFSADASVSGSGEGYNWTVGYAHMGDQAIMAGSNYSRDNLNFKGHFKTGRTTSIDANVRYSKVNVRGSGANSINDSGTNSGNGRLKHAVSYAPIPVVASLQDADEEQNYGDNAPPLRSISDNDSKRIRTTWNANAAFNWEIIDNLRLKVEGGLEDYRQSDDRFYGITTYAVANDADYQGYPQTQHKDAFRTRYRNTNTLSYDFGKVLGEDHSLNAILGEEMTITKSNTVSSTAKGFALFYDAEMAWDFMSSAPWGSTNNYINPDDKLLSFFGRVNYDYKHRYSLGATLRTDGSSKFARGKRWGFFPSAAASWTISNEPWMDNSREWLDQLKLRYSFGTAGNNNIPSGQLLTLYYSSVTSWLSMTNNYFGTPHYDELEHKTINVMSNSNLTWETTYTHNIGLDFSLWQSRLNGSIEVYQNDTKDLLIKFPIPGSGYDHQYQNVGSTRNRGIELTLNAPIVSKKDFSLNISGNIAYNKNVVTDLGGLESITAQSYWASSEIGDDYIVQVGQPLGNMYGYISDGMYTVDDFTWNGSKWVLNEGVVDCSELLGDYMRPGAPKYKELANVPVYDENGKITGYTTDGKVTVADRTVIGNAAPDFTGGFSLSAFWKGFDFSANFNFMIGNEVYNANKIEFTSSRKFFNRNLVNMMDVDKRWCNIDWTTGELVNDPETLKAMNAGKTMWNPAIPKAVFSDWAVEDASFLRLQTLTLGYTLPEKLTEKVHVRRARIYATGTNLFCLTNYSGYDPEVDTRRATPLTPGVDYSAYPKSIGFVAGINLSF
ncbi:MAG: TonB-dependent receptor [Bacteroidales bacterium]|nr:TonB-dependent receptor [Bacteroidales bacterium]